MNVVKGQAVQQYEPSDGEKNITVEILIAESQELQLKKKISFQCRQLH